MTDIPDIPAPSPAGEPSRGSTPTPTGRVIDLAVEVPGTPEEVWDAIATGPGITSWFVPSTVEERAGGAMTQRFGPGMDVDGRVAAWDPPRRVVFDGGDEGEGLAFEWTVQARDGGLCVVRLVSSGFGAGEEWDAQYDGMSEGWRLFLSNLHAHRTHFAGQRAQSALPMAVWAGARDEVWGRLCTELGLPSAATAGDWVATATPEAPRLAGEVLGCEPGFRMNLLLTSPAAGTAFLAAERYGEAVGVSAWLWLYGDSAAETAAVEGARWQEWLSVRGVAPVVAEPPSAAD